MRSVSLLLTAAATAALTTALSAAPNEDFNKLLDAISQVESNNDPGAVGDGGRAIGSYQIHRLYWKDGTRILGVEWEYRDARDPRRARRVVSAYLRHYGKGKSLSDMARIHNGGPRGHRKKATLRYARKVLEVMEKADS
jgi:soluble lytic murein transglycosylase-like protein